MTHDDRNSRDDDNIQRFHLADSAVRGEIVRIRASLREVTTQHFYPAPVAQLLGEALAASVLLSSSIKFAGTLSLQAKSDGAVAILFAECNHLRRVRGYARLRDGPLAENIGLLDKGTLAITIAPEQTQRYQGIVPLDGATLAQCLEHYFAQSEQLPTIICLAATEENAAGLMLQAMPEANRDAHALPQWDTLRQLAQTLRPEELLHDAFETLLYHLFHEQEIRVQPPAPVQFGCSCSAERAGNTLKAIGERETRDALAQQGKITIHCEFCQQEYLFDEQAVSRLFAAGDRQTMH